VGDRVVRRVSRVGAYACEGAVVIALGRGRLRHRCCHLPVVLVTARVAVSPVKATLSPCRRQVGVAYVRVKSDAVWLAWPTTF
jgi:hypothetical protein